jgi:hypothetical protein
VVQKATRDISLLLLLKKRKQGLRVRSQLIECQVKRLGYNRSVYEWDLPTVEDKLKTAYKEYYETKRRQSEL